MEEVVALQALIKAASLISEPEFHTRGEFARDENNQKVNVYSLEAKKFCSVGAVRHVCRHSYRTETLALRMLTEAMCPDQNIHSLNDLLTHDQLMARWSKALDILKQRYPM